jgi:hypothetical protein
MDIRQFIEHERTLCGGIMRLTVKNKEIRLEDCSVKLNDILGSPVFSFGRHTGMTDVGTLRSLIFAMCECQERQLMRLAKELGTIGDSGQIFRDRNKVLNEPLFRGEITKENRMRVLEMVQKLSDSNAGLLFKMKREVEK